MKVIFPKCNTDIAEAIASKNNHLSTFLKKLIILNPCYASIVVLKGISNDDLTFGYKLKDISPHQLTSRV